MISASDLRKGSKFLYRSEPHLVLGFQHVKPGKGGAFVRSTLKNLRTGRVLDNTFRAGEKIEPGRVERRKYQFLYREPEALVLMDNETYEQLPVAVNLFDGRDKFLKEGDEIDLLLDDNDQIVTVEIPLTVQLKVLETDPGFRGNTATNAVKSAKVETGTTVNVPLFINIGDVLKVDTRTGEYLERVKG